jgi:putative Mn2+ efflux pump MntP
MLADIAIHAVTFGAFVLAMCLLGWLAERLS